MPTTSNVLDCADRQASFASHPERSRGRYHRESESPERTVYQRDRNRIIASAAFRRLKHKTQVFVYYEGDYYRTRLTHSLEVAQIARTMARSLGVNEDLAETLALAHDLGHPPFGHSGEDALNTLMQPFGGFDHNGQALRIVTTLEARYAKFDGLNLTWETLEGLAKHNGPLPPEQPVPWSIADYIARHDLELTTWPGIEAQIAALADDIAYHSHDLDDGLRAGLFSTDCLTDVPLVGPIVADLRQSHPDLEMSRLVHEIGRRLTGFVFADAVSETRQRLRDAAPAGVEDVRNWGQPLVGFSPMIDRANGDLKAFLYETMYGHHRVRRMAVRARRVLSDLFRTYMDDPCCMPEEWRIRAIAGDKQTKARLICDYIAGMTDRFALREHQRLFSVFEERP